MKKFSSTIYIALIISSVAMLFLACAAMVFRSMEGVIWHTSYHITYQSDKDYDDDILRLMNDVDAELSPFNKKSNVSLLNVSDSVQLTAMLRDVFLKAQEIYVKSNGYFDPTAAPLISAYGFGAGEKSMPDSLAIDSMLQFIGMDKTFMRGEYIVKKDRRMQFNFSALAKGYGCDCVGRLLAHKGVENFMVEIGGEIVVRGHNPQGDKWHISIDKPIEDNEGAMHESQLIVAVTDCAIATSGSYRNFRDEGDKRISHIVNPRTGQPAATDIVSATVITHDCITADALATACMALGSEQAMQLAAKQKFALYLILADGSTRATDSFRALVQPKK